MITEDALKRNLNIFTALMGNEKDIINVRGLILKKRIYEKNSEDWYLLLLRGILATSGFSTLKVINRLSEWDKEHIFYNPLSSKAGKTLKLTKFWEERNIFTLDQILEEKIKAVRGQPVKKTAH